MAVMLVLKYANRLHPRLRKHSSVKLFNQRIEHPRGKMEKIDMELIDPSVEPERSDSNRIASKKDC